MIVRQADDKTAPRTCSPKSDFLLNTPYVPIIINETISPADESDRYRMLLAYVRVGHHLRTNRDLIILCFYLNTDLNAERYLVYQTSTATDKTKVCAPTMIRRPF
jgi:hypothetical protein